MGKQQHEFPPADGGHADRLVLEDGVDGMRRGDEPRTPDSFRGLVDSYTVQTLIAPKKYAEGRALVSAPGKVVEELGTDALVIADEGERAREYAIR